MAAVSTPGGYGGPSVADMDPKEAATAATDALKSMNLSTDETERLGKTFKDPEFMKIFQEYVDEIQDPKNREETEAYLRQVESMGQTKDVYGEGTKLITPKADYVIKTKVVKVLQDPAGSNSSVRNKTPSQVGRKYFLNICSNDQITEASSTTVKGGKNWSLPHSLGIAREGKDKSDKVCDESDIVLHPNTIALGEKDYRFKQLIVDTAFEAVEKDRFIKLSKEYSLPKMKYKGPTNHPAVQAWRNPSGSQSGASSTQRDPSVSIAGKKGKEEPKLEEAQRQSSSFNLNFEQSSKERTAAQAKSRERELPSGEFEPQYEIIHRHTRNDYGDAWQGEGVRSAGSRPTSLVVRIHLPRLDTIASVDLDVTPEKITLEKSGTYNLIVPMPFVVDDAKGKAKFDKSKRTLEINLPVLPEKQTEPLPFVEPADEALELEEKSENETVVAEDNAEFEGHSSSSDSDPKPAESAAERAWRQLHEERDAMNENVAEPSGMPFDGNGQEDDVREEKDEVTVEARKSGGDCGLDTAAREPVEVEPVKSDSESESDEEEEIPVVVKKSTVKLAPRLSSAGVFELD